MITYDEFVTKHNGKALDYDGCAGVQCVDLAKYYLDEVFDIKPGGMGRRSRLLRRLRVPPGASQKFYQDCKYS